MKLTITEMKKRHKAIGGHWFDKDTMRFFGTTIESLPNAANIFITSEWTGPDETKRAYTLRWFNTETDKVETLGEFLHYQTLEEAREGRKVFTQAKKSFGITA